MKQNGSIKPEDILADGVDTTIINGMNVRKGTIAAFLANVEILENETTTKLEKDDAINMLNELAPAVKAIGLSKHVIFKNAEVQQILLNAKVNYTD